MALPPDKTHLEGFVQLLVERLLEDAREILNDEGDVPAEYSAEDEPPRGDD